MTIGIAGHPYVLHDEQVSHNLIKRLRAAGVTVLTPEMATENPDSNGNGQTQFAGLAKNYWNRRKTWSEPAIIIPVSRSMVS